jgi:hypothetical protein
MSRQVWVFFHKVTSQTKNHTEIFPKKVSGIVTGEWKRKNQFGQLARALKETIKGG